MVCAARAIHVQFEVDVIDVRVGSTVRGHEWLQIRIQSAQNASLGAFSRSRRHAVLLLPMRACPVRYRNRHATQ